MMLRAQRAVRLAAEAEAQAGTLLIEKLKLMIKKLHDDLAQLLALTPLGKHHPFSVSRSSGRAVFTSKSEHICGRFGDEAGDP